MLSRSVYDVTRGKCYHPHRGVNLQDYLSKRPRQCVFTCATPTKNSPFIYGSWQSPLCLSRDLIPSENFSSIFLTNRGYRCHNVIAYLV